jgi:hypothetical protein
VIRPHVFNKLPVTASKSQLHTRELQTRHSAATALACAMYVTSTPAATRWMVTHRSFSRSRPRMQSFFSFIKTLPWRLKASVFSLNTARSKNSWLNIPHNILTEHTAQYTDWTYRALWRSTFRILLYLYTVNVFSKPHKLKLLYVGARVETGDTLVIVVGFSD